MLTRQILEELNAPPDRAGRRSLPVGGLAAAATVLLAGLGYLLGSPAVGLAAVALLAGGAFSLWRARRPRARTVGLSYGLMDAATGTRLERMQRGFEVLSQSRRLWREQKREDGSVELEPVDVLVADPPGASTDVDAWTVEAGASKLCFLPDAMLLLEEGRYSAIPYQGLAVDLDSRRVVERGEVPEDAEVFEKARRHPPQDGAGAEGTTDASLTQVVYATVRFSSKGWRGVTLWCPSETAAAQFVLAFLQNAGPERIERWRETRVGSERGRGDPALKALGLAEDASRGEVTAAYRRMARSYHPDKTVDFLPEFRALADLRMKQINAAYSRLRREAT